MLFRSHVFECKSEKKGIFGINYFSNIKLIFAVLASLAVILAAIYLPGIQMIFDTVALSKTPLLISLGFSFAVPVVSGIAGIFHKNDMDS